MSVRNRSLWSFLPLENRRIPDVVIRESARSSLRNLLNWIRGGTEKSNFSIDAELHTVPSDLLNALAPVPDWGEAAESFIQVLENSNARSGASLTQPVLIGPPGSGTSHILELVALKEGYTVLASPSPSDILEGGLSWLKNHPFEQEMIYVIPELEKFYFRHHHGLRLIRALAEEIKEKEIKVIVGCDSWAWAYLTQVVGLYVCIGPYLTLDAFDGILLSIFFTRLAGITCQSGIVFRSSDTGTNIMVSGDAQNPCSAERGMNGNGEYIEAPEILRLIASRSHGIPLVAWAMWRQCLEMASDEAIDESSLQNATPHKPSTIWVSPWPKVALPKLTSPVDNRELIILHTLLIHSGLPMPILSELLPLSEIERNSLMERLNSAGLVKLDDKEWRVSLLGYPSVRDNLAAEGYLVDKI